MSSKPFLMSAGSARLDGAGSAPSPGERFPLSSRYHPDWIRSAVSGGAHPLWLAEWLAEALDLRPGMRVLDLGCGRAASSIFLHRECGVEVWAADLWNNPSDNLKRIRDAGAGAGVFPLRADARALPFAEGFFDAVACIDCFPYFGTDDLYLSNLARFVKPAGVIGIAGAGLVREIDGPLPAHLQEWWTPEHWALHSAAWWRRHWDRTDILAVERADDLAGGWRLWRDWHLAEFPGNHPEIAALERDQGEYLGYIRVVGRRSALPLPEPLTALPPEEYARAPLLRGV